MSKSWISVSRKMVQCGIGVGSPRPGSRVVERNSCGTPILPAFISSYAVAKPLANRRLKPTCRATPAVLAALMALSASSRVTAIGFSQNTPLPALAAATTSSAWVRAGEAITTASISGSFSRSCGSVYDFFAPSLAANFSAAPGTGSATAIRVAPGTR